MRYSLTSLLFGILLLCSAPAFAQGPQPGGTGLIYGTNHAFTLTAPKGWVLDNEAGASEGIYAVFYREGESWKDGTAVMYVNTSGKADRSMEEWIDEDILDFNTDYPDLVVKEGNDILFGKVRALVRYYSSKSYGQNEAVAYINAGKTGVIIVLTSRDKAAFDKALGDFEKLVRSYQFVTDKVEMKNVPQK